MDKYSKHELLIMSNGYYNSRIAKLPLTPKEGYEFTCKMIRALNKKTNELINANKINTVDELMEAINTSIEQSQRAVDDIVSRKENPSK
jgi:hypothetical protein